MKFTPINPPREFKVGYQEPIMLKDTAHLSLETNEQVTFKTASGTEYDVVRKSWGYYATPSLNQRLPKYGLKPVLIKSPDGKVFLMLCEKGKEQELDAYLKKESLKVVCWLDSDQRIAELESALQGKPCEA